jgi:predicted DNA-binding protein
MKRRMIPITVHVTDEQYKALFELSSQTGKAVAQYVRDGIDLNLKQRRDERTAEVRHSANVMLRTALDELALVVERTRELAASATAGVRP